MDRRQVQTSQQEAEVPTTFAESLRSFRERVGLSQSRLAAASGYDHSYVSRLESASRMPTREAVIKLSQAMGLEALDSDRLLASAGFMPENIENLLAAEPIVGEILGLLQDREVPRDVREDLRSAISMAVRQAQRATPNWVQEEVAGQTVAAD